MCSQRPLASLARIMAAALAAAGIYSCAASGAVYSEPVGFLKVSIPAAAPMRSSSKLIGIPFQRATVFTGSISSAGTNLITCIEPGWIAAQFTAAPHFVKILSGNAIGRIALILANTADTISFDGPALPLNTADNFAVFPAHTLASAFNPPLSNGLLESGSTASTASLVRFLENGSWASYFHNGAAWQAADGTGERNTKIFGPDQPALIVNRTSNELTLTLLGTVSIGTETNTISSDGLSGFAPRFPVSRSLKDLGIQLYSGWKKASTASTSDSLLLWSENSWRIYYHNGDHWLSVGSFANQDNTSIEAGQGLVIRRKAGSINTSEVVRSDRWFPYQTSD